jgi:hypothetical protein
MNLMFLPKIFLPIQPFARRFEVKDLVSHVLRARPRSFSGLRLSSVIERR